MDKDNYRLIDFSDDSLAMQRETDKFTTEINRNAHSIYYTRNGYDNGIHQTFELEVIDGCWRLIKFSDMSM